jgi:hypothetical protein
VLLKKRGKREDKKINKKHAPVCFELSAERDWDLNILDPCAVTWVLV